MSRYCLDTSAYSHFQRGEVCVVQRLDRAEWVAVPSVVLGELRAGFLLGGHADRNESDLADFLSHECVEAVDVDRRVAALYAEIFVDQKKRGVPMPTNDLWVAAVAAHLGVPVLTFDRHFETIGRVGSVVIEVEPT